MRFAAFVRVAAIAALASPIAAPLAAQREPVDVATIERIKQEAFERSQVMDIMSWLTDVHGPRLTGSPIAKAAGDWTIETLRKWGVENVHYEWWGPFGRGWVTEKFSANMITPHPFQLIAYLAAWSPGTDGPAQGEVVRVSLDTEEDLAANRGKLRGKWVMTAPAPTGSRWLPGLPTRHWRGWRRSSRRPRPSSSSVRVREPSRGVVLLGRT
jgi:carboxypeptidase Q